MSRTAIAGAPVWLLTGSRPGEIAQQRLLGEAIGLPYRELQVATLAASGGRARFDLDALRPPWPRIAIAFGKTLPAAVALRAASAGATRIVQLGRPRGVRFADLDLIVPMPPDRVADAPNVLRIRMPFNRPGEPVDTDAHEQRLRDAGLQRPYTALIVGGITRQHRFADRDIVRLARKVHARVRGKGGSLLVSTSPRTPVAAIELLRGAIDLPNDFYVFQRNDPLNPLRAYLRLADELIVTGDSASMVAECWRTGSPLLVAPMPRSIRQYVVGGLRRCLSPLVEHGHIAADVDINGWLAGLAAEGHIGLLGSSEPHRHYRPELDDDLQRAAQCIRALL